MCHAIEEKKYDKGVKSGKNNLNILTDVCISDVALQFSNIIQPKHAAGFLIGNKDVASSLLNNLKKKTVFHYFLSKCIYGRNINILSHSFTSCGTVALMVFFLSFFL
jgi:hypothetical protein